MFFKSPVHVFSSRTNVLFCRLNNGVCIPTLKANKVHIYFFLSQYPLHSCMVYGTPNVVKQFVVHALWVFRYLITFFFGPFVVCPLRCNPNSTTAMSAYESKQPVQPIKWISYRTTTFVKPTNKNKFHLRVLINTVSTGRS
jgi:hypothetical protein